ncbi:hypothetical protein AMEX_G4261 [Astyanax mexicanus]|uniref:Immunoglobulin V-set domain-containing protein n=1 Tax=Astyanax mexicanus TaxID=7994 RepID=A0A8T2MHH4_ASTMX|nr:hypothetical protein AMEX_G4261 [Astyanax mexicanus]
MKSLLLCSVVILWLALCLAPLSAQSRVFMTARVGSSVVLPCDCTAVCSNQSSNEGLHIEWRTFTETVFESLGEEHYEGEGYEGRVDVPEDELKKGNCSLVLKEVKAEDAGVYQSYLMVKQQKRFLQPKRVFIQSVELSVHDPVPTKSTDVQEKQLSVGSGGVVSPVLDVTLSAMLWTLVMFVL